MDSIVLEKSILGGDADGVESPRHDLRWMYITYPEDDKTQLNAIVYDHVADTDSVHDFNLTGEYDLEAYNDIGWDCAVFRNFED